MKKYLLLLLFLLPGIMLCNAQVEEEDEEEDKQETVEEKKKQAEEAEEEEDEEEDKENGEPPLLPPPVPHRHFVINPFSFLLSGFEIGYGKCNEKNQYIRFYGGYYFSEEAGIYNDNDGEPGFGITPSVTYKNMEQFRFELQYAKMFSTTSTLQYYYGFYGIVKSLSVEVSRSITNPGSTISSNYKAKALAASPGLLLGVRQYFRQHVFVDVFGGGGITLLLDGTNVDDVHRGTILPYKRSINPRLGLSLGVTF